MLHRAITTLSVGALLLTACTGQPDPSGSPLRSPGGPTSTEVGLATPRIAERDPARPRYDRDEWQPRGWRDVDGDGCNTRAEVLMAESSEPTVSRPGSCTVVSGRWVDPWTGREFTAAAHVEVDHLVALGDAAASGGWAWPADRKAAFADDLADEWALNATASDENQRKADHGPDRWLPPAPAARCTYVAAYARIKARWDLAVTPSQWAAILSVWERCTEGAL